MLVWLDLETTGLHPRTDRILEIGFIVTDDDLTEGSARSWVLPFTGAVDDFIARMHGARYAGGNGLLEDCRMAAADKDYGLPFIHAEVMSYLKSVLPTEGDKIPLAGSTVDFDKNFLRESGALFGPVLDLFHYRIIDVSVVKELVRRWYPKVYEGRPTRKEQSKHRVLDDLRDSIGELAYYKKHVFVGFIDGVKIKECAGCGDELESKHYSDARFVIEGVARKGDLCVPCRSRLPIPS